MTTTPTIETNNNVKMASKEEIDKLYQYFTKKNKSIYEKLERKAQSDKKLHNSPPVPAK